MNGWIFRDQKTRTTIGEFEGFNAFFARSIANMIPKKSMRLEVPECPLHVTRY